MIRPGNEARTDLSCFSAMQVTAAHKRHGTPPHCIFAIDNLVRRAANTVLTIVSPDTANRLGSFDEARSVHTPTRSPSLNTLTRSLSSSSLEHSSLRDRLKVAVDENLLLLGELVRLQEDANSILRNSIAEHRLRLQAGHSSPSVGTPRPRRVTFNEADNEEDPALLEWLKECEVDERVQQKVLGFS